MGAAREGDVLIRLEKRPGDFVPHLSGLGAVWPAERCSDSLAGQIRDAFILAPYPSIEHDIEFGMRQMADIAVKALSPGINDPTTATNAIDLLGVVLSHAIGREIPSPLRRDGDGTCA